MVGISGVGENFDSYVGQMDELVSLSRAREKVEHRLKDPSLSEEERRRLKDKLAHIRKKEKDKTAKLT